MYLACFIGTSKFKSKFKKYYEKQQLIIVTFIITMTLIFFYLNNQIYCENVNY